LHYADLVIEGNIYTMDESKPFAKSVAIKGDRIIFVGDNANDMIGKETIVVNAEGKSVLPGFIDTHVHFVGTAISRFDDLDVFGIPSISEDFRSHKTCKEAGGAVDKGERIRWSRSRGILLGRNWTQ
jgi:predicted amidohydrolase YtcJ